jgi:hypothetical protein
MNLPTDSKARKNMPMARGLLDYFPDALAAVAELSMLGNEKHNPGQPLHWSKHKSTDHADCVIRHLADRGKWIDGEYEKPVRHSTGAAWRALANLQIEIEAERAGSTVEAYLKNLAALASAVGVPVADADGWIEWNGGARPLFNGETEVMVKFRGSTNEMSAGNGLGLNWNHDGGLGDIVAYKVVSE